MAGSTRWVVPPFGLRSSRSAAARVLATSGLAPAASLMGSSN
jgi:hypothetical protein